jgi:hypothetical protein
MKKKINRIGLLVAILLQLCSMSRAQLVCFSDAEKFDKTFNSFLLIGKVSQQTYTVTCYNKEYVLHIYNDRLEVQKNIVLDFLPNKCELMEAFIYDNNSIVLLYKYIDKGIGYAEYANLNLDGLLKRQSIVFEKKTNLFKGDVDEFNWAISDDKKQFVIYNAKQRQSSFQIQYCFNTADSLSAIHNLSVPTNEIAILSKFVLNKEGVLAMFIQDVSSAMDKPYSHALATINLKSASIGFSSIPIPLNAYALEHIITPHAVSNQFILSLIVKSKAKQVNKELQLFQIAEQGAKANLLASYAFNSVALFAHMPIGKSNDFQQFHLSKALCKTDGSIFLELENYYETSRVVNMGGFSVMAFGSAPMSNTKTIREFHYGQLLVLNLDKEGSIKWQSLVDKEQFSQDDEGYFSSYSTVLSGGNILYFYSTVGSDKIRGQLVAVDAATGKLDLEPLHSYKNETSEWVPRSAMQISANELLIPCIKKKQFYLTKLIF